MRVTFAVSIKLADARWRFVGPTPNEHHPLSSGKPAHAFASEDEAYAALEQLYANNPLHDARVVRRLHAVQRS